MRIYVEYPYRSSFYFVKKGNEIPNLGNKIKEFAEKNGIPIRRNISDEEAWLRQYNEGGDTNQLEGLMRISSPVYLIPYGEETHIAVRSSSKPVRFIGSGLDNNGRRFYFEYNGYIYTVIRQLLVGPRDWRYCDNWLEGFVEFLMAKGCRRALRVYVGEEESEKTKKKMKKIKENTVKRIREYLKDKKFENYWEPRAGKDGRVVARVIGEIYKYMWGNKISEGEKWIDSLVFLKREVLLETIKKIKPIIEFPPDCLPEDSPGISMIEQLIEKNTTSLGDSEPHINNEEAESICRFLEWLGILRRTENQISMPETNSKLKIISFHFVE